MDNLINRRASGDFSGKSGGGFRRNFGRRHFKKNFGDTEQHFEPEEPEQVINDFVFGDDFEFRDFEDKIAKKILYSIFKMDFLKPTEIQRQVLSNADSGDLIAQSNTGSGKTLAFTVPILNDILNKKVEKVLILAPTREIAFQINDLMNKIIRKSWNITNTVLVGGVPIDRQIDRLKKNIDIIIGTPGRIIDLLDRKKLDLSSVNFIILDEFDRMLDMGFREDVRIIINKCNKNSRKFMLSATLNDKVKQDANEYLKEPKIIVVKNSEDNSINVNIKQFFEHYDGYEDKKKKLFEILTNYHGKSILIFTNTKFEAEKIVNDLYLENIVSEYIHGDLHQKKRQSIIKNFGDKFRILVATDLVARGLNISSLELVVNYDIPKNVEDYTHRIGRTARGEDKEGHSISLFNHRDASFLNDLVKLLKVKIEDKKVLEVIESKFNRTDNFGKRRGFSSNFSSNRFGSRSSGFNRGKSDNRFNDRFSNHSSDKDRRFPANRGSSFRSNKFSRNNSHGHKNFS